MAIVKMKKFTLLAFESQKKELLKNLQQLQSVQFSEIDVEESELKDYLKQDSAYVEISEIEDKQSQIKTIIDLLHKFQPKKSGLKELKEGKESLTYENLQKRIENIDWKSQYAVIKDREGKLNKKHSKIDKLIGEIEQLSKWEKLDIPLNAAKGFRTCIAHLGTVPNNIIDSMREELSSNFEDCYIEVISADAKDSYIFLLFHKDNEKEIENLLKRYSFSTVEYDYQLEPKEVIREFSSKIKEIQEEILEIEEELKVYARNIQDFKLIYEFNESELLRLNSYQNFLKSKNTVTIEGYVPSENSQEFEKVIKNVLDNAYYLELEDAKGDETPVLLKNNSVVECFEPITEMYSLPKYTEIDPTALLMPFYFIFFGMMLSDAAYGIILFVGALIGLKFFNLDDEMRKTVKMFCLLGLSTTFWGIMYGSYFGDAIKLPAIWMKPDSNVMLLMIVSVGLGLVQIYIGLGVKAYMLIRDGKVIDALCDVGFWYLTLTGLLLWGLGGFGVINSPTVTMVAKYAAIAGMVLIVLTNGREANSIGGKLGQGFYSLYNITGYVGDLVSYTRLAALGLATGFIGTAFNMMVGMFPNIYAKIIAGGLIFLAGHLFNLFINALGAYVHTSRLQYLEYFGKFYEGGGNAFKPLKYSSKYIKIVK